MVSSTELTAKVRTIRMRRQSQNRKLALPRARLVAAIASLSIPCLAEGSGIESKAEESDRSGDADPPFGVIER